MAEKRMFAKSIIDSDIFLDMPASSQMLYFHLVMRADDDGFIDNPKRIQRLTGCSDDDAKLLILKQFILPFDSGVIVIKHWRIHNYIRSDRYKPTAYQEEMSHLYLDENGSYNVSTSDFNLGIPNDNQAVYQMTTNCQPTGIPTGIPNDNQMSPQYRIGKGNSKSNNNSIIYNNIYNNNLSLENSNQLGLTDNTHTSNNKTTKIFMPPTIEEVQSYCRLKGYDIDPEEFWYHYDSNGWMVGKNKMKSWHSAIGTWICNKRKGNFVTQSSANQVQQSIDGMQALREKLARERGLNG